MGETMETAADFLCLGSKITAAMKLKDACFLEGLILKLKLQYLGHLMRRTDLFEKTLTLGKISGSRRKGCREWDGWMASPIQWTWVWASSRSWRWRGKPGVLQSMGLQKVGHVWWTELNWTWWWWVQEACVVPCFCSSEVAVGFLVFLCLVQNLPQLHLYCCYWVAKLCSTLCDPVDCSTLGFLSSIISQNLLRFMSVESVILS